MKSANEFPIGVVLSLGQYHTLARDQFRGRRIRSLERCLHGQYECRTELLNDGAPGARQVFLSSHSTRRSIDRDRGCAR